MSLTRKVCTLINSLRKENNLPNKLKLHEVQIKTDGFILRECRKLISEECNIDQVEPFFIEDDHDWWIEKGDGDVFVKLCNVRSPVWEKEYQMQKEYRKKMMEAKKSGNYNENTYKKFK